LAEDVFRLFDDYAARHARGERPDAREYLERAGEGADELRDLLDVFLSSTPPPAPDEERVAAFRAWLAGEPPLLELRTRRGVKRAMVVDALVERLGLDPAKREKVAGYVHRVETGLIPSGPVDRRVWEVWAETLRARVEDLVAWTPRPLAARSGAYYRADEDRAATGALRPPDPGQRDEIDELFIGRR
jgi:hypothetical protein